MTNQERIQEYLVGESGYLKSDISNGKVVMLSGKWGSGKTHFWQNNIATDELKEELNSEQKVYSYISLYGKSSIEEIENDIFGQVYIDAIGGDNFVRKGVSTFTKKLKRFGSTKLAKGLEEEQEDNIERIALERLNNGGIICFDDFERKSKDIDLNDLFGFITQLTLNFKCKVVIILNDDVFEGKEKDIFSNVKEKTVSKFLYYAPAQKDLFNLVFSEDKYKSLEEYKSLIFECFTISKEINIRIYIQVLDNLLEWNSKVESKLKEKKYLRYLILQNINFIINHNTLILELYSINNGILLPRPYPQSSYKSNAINKVIEKLHNEDDKKYIKNRKIHKEFTSNLNTLSDNEIKSIYFLKLTNCMFNNTNVTNNRMEIKVVEYINKFIETGILINEEE